MKIYDSLVLAWKDIKNRRIRSCLTILAISMGTMLLIAMLSLGDTILDYTNKTKSNIGKINRISVLPVSYEKISNNKEYIEESIKKNSTIAKEEGKSIFRWDVDAINNIEGVKYTQPFIREKITELEIGEEKPRKYKGEIIGVEKRDGVYIEEEILNDNVDFDFNEGILVGEEILKNLGIKDTRDVVGKNIKITIEGNENHIKRENNRVIIEGNISGVIEKKSFYCDKILVPNNRLKELRENITLNDGRDVEYDGVDVFIDYEENPIIVVDKITKSTGLVAFSYRLITTLADILSGGVKGILASGGIIVIIIASLGLVNTMAMSIEEKKSIIAVMRAVGANKKDIRMIFIFQGLIIGVIGGFLGSIFSNLLLYLINIVIEMPKGIVINISSFNIVIAIFITVVVTIVASFLPANKASKSDIIKTLREE